MHAYMQLLNCLLAGCEVCIVYVSWDGFNVLIASKGTQTREYPESW